MMAMFLSFMGVQAFDAARIGQGGRRPRLPSMADMTGVRRNASPRRRVADLCGAIHENLAEGKGGGLPLKPPRFRRKSAPEITGILDIAPVSSASPSRSAPMSPVPSLAAAVDRAAPPRREADAGRRLRRVSLTLGAVAAIELAAIAAQFHFGAVGDVSWMITICEKWLDGGTPYVDFIETNPPASILLYMPAVALARLIGARPEALVAASGFAAVGAALWLSAAILRRARLIAQIGPATLGLALVALTILPGRTFDERDFFVTLFALPYLALTAAR